MRPHHPAPLGSLFVPALAAFFTCLVIGLAISALLGLPMRGAVPAGLVVSGVVAVFCAMRGRAGR